MESLRNWDSTVLVYILWGLLAEYQWLIFLSKQAVYFYSSLHDITCVGVVEVSGEGKR